MYISRAGLGEYIQPQVYDGIFDPNGSYDSIVMSLGERIQVGTKETIIPVVGTVPTAEFVEKTGTQAAPVPGTYPEVDAADAPDIGYKPVSELTLTDQRIVLEKLAVIVPIADCVLQDTNEEVLENLIRTKSEEAIARRFDQAALLGVNPPASYGNGIIADAIAAGNVVDVAAGAAATAKLTAVDSAWAMVEEGGYTVTDIAVQPAFNSIFRTAMITNSNIIISPDVITQRPRYIFYGVPLTTAKILQGTQYAALPGEWNMVKWATRSDFEVTVSNQATITNADGSTYNLYQQDMTGFRTVLRIGYTVLHGAGNYPIAVVRLT